MLPAFSLKAPRRALIAGRSFRNLLHRGLHTVQTGLAAPGEERGLLGDSDDFLDRLYPFLGCCRDFLRRGANLGCGSGNLTAAARTEADAASSMTERGTNPANCRWRCRRSD
jgi:hypothetical protein